MANLGIAVAKSIGFMMTGAASMLAEAVHSIADMANQGLLLHGGTRASRKATIDHPFGYGRERYFWAFVVSVVIFVLGGVFAIVSGISRWLEPHAVTYPAVAVSILVVAMILEGWSLRTAVREASLIRGPESWWTFIRSTKNAELPVILLEDVGALAGLFIAFLGIGLSELTGNARFDAAGSILIGMLLCSIALILAIEMKSLLIGEAAMSSMEEEIAIVLLEEPNVIKMIHMRTTHLGPEELLIAAKLELNHSLSFEGVTSTINRAEQRLRTLVPVAHIIYLEPDLFRAQSSEIDASEPSDSL
jgi:cation diffusion facilitator family transporter